MSGKTLVKGPEQGIGADDSDFLKATGGIWGDFPGKTSGFGVMFEQQKWC